MNKDSSGLGFCDLQGFNLTMLGKLSWKFISNPNSLLSHLLKAKYFLDEDFLNVGLGHYSNYIWRSIWCSRALLAYRILWKIGDSSRINVWRDPWLRDPENHFIHTPLFEELQDLKVQDLMIPFSTSWDIELIEEIFCERDVKEILSIPLQNDGLTDFRIWNL